MQTRHDGRGEERGKRGCDGVRDGACVLGLGRVGRVDGGVGGVGWRRRGRGRGGDNELRFVTSYHTISSFLRPVPAPCYPSLPPPFSPPPFVNGFTNLVISSSLTTRSLSDPISLSQTTHVCADSLALNMGRAFAGCQVKVVREASAWQRMVCRSISVQWSGW